VRKISGRGGALYSLGEPFSFSYPMRDTGDGWTWEVPGVRYLDEETLAIQLKEQKWTDLEPLELHVRTGRVTFSRCLSRLEIRASGVGRTALAIAAAEWWQIELAAVVAERSALGVGDVQTMSRPLSSSALLKTIGPVTGEVLVELPFARTGVYVGVGNALPTSLGTEITFNQEGVLYEPA
jgi:hypothetical protein